LRIMTTSYTNLLKSVPVPSFARPHRTLVPKPCKLPWCLLQRSCYIVAIVFTVALRNTHDSIGTETWDCQIHWTRPSQRNVKLGCHGGGLGTLWPMDWYTVANSGNCWAILSQCSTAPSVASTKDDELILSYCCCLLCYNHNCIKRRNGLLLLSKIGNDANRIWEFALYAWLASFLPFITAGSGSSTESSHTSCHVEIYKTQFISQYSSAASVSYSVDFRYQRLWWWRASEWRCGGGGGVSL
jgi:hypothetical protein